MDELVMMRSVGVGAGSAAASIISSVRSLPEKPRRTGKKNSFYYSLACAKFEWKFYSIIWNFFFNFWIWRYSIFLFFKVTDYWIFRVKFAAIAVQANITASSVAMASLWIFLPTVLYVCARRGFDLNSIWMQIENEIIRQIEYYYTDSLFLNDCCLWRLFGILQAQHPSSPGLHLQSPGRAEKLLPSRQDSPQSMPSLSPPQMLRSQHEQRW